MKTSTVPTTAPAWRIVDAEGKNLGRLATAVATALRGKDKPSFSPHQLCGDHVVVINAEKLHFHPSKLYRKSYVKHTGYIGHISRMFLGEKMEKNPEEVIERAVKGMLPRNRLRPQMLKRLHVVKGPEHKYAAQKPEALSV